MGAPAGLSSGLPPTAGYCLEDGEIPLSEFRGLLKLICMECRGKAPVLVGDRFRWRCHHHKLSVFEGIDLRYLEYDQDSARPFLTQG